MGTTNIEWAHYTVNPAEGCSKISPACKNCYAEHDTPVRLVEHAMGVQRGAEPADGKIRLKMWGEHNPSTGTGYRVETVGWEKQLRMLNRKAAAFRKGYESTGARHYERPRVFINSLSDTFEAFEGPVYRKQNRRFEVVANSLAVVRKRLFACIEECTELDILLLTKRPENVLGMVPSHWAENPCGATGLQQIPFCPMPIGHAGGCSLAPRNNHSITGWPSWVWVGATVENQEMADKRIPELLRIPAWVRFLSMEPLLGEVDLDSLCLTVPNSDTYSALYGWRTSYQSKGRRGECSVGVMSSKYERIHWVIVGGESGTNARPMNPDWARKIRDQCQAAGVPYFFKQWGEWGDPDSIEHTGLAVNGWHEDDGAPMCSWPGDAINGIEIPCTRPTVYKVGKKAAGRLLDGREWNEVPK